MSEEPPSGIYRIRNVKDNKIYVGSSVNLTRRWRYHHLGRLRRNTHWNPHLQSAWNRDGESSFLFEVLEKVSSENLLVREQHWLDSTNCCDRNIGYNISPKADRSVWSEESKRKASESRKGKAPLPVGWHHTDESKRLIAAGQVGRPKPPFSAEHRAKLGARIAGKTMVELYGAEKAEDIRVKKSLKMKEYHERRKAGLGSKT